MCDVECTLELEYEEYFENIVTTAKVFCFHLSLNLL